jgi:hypothetical protein
MTRFAVSVASVGAFCLGITLNASAEPITITGGSLVFPTGDFFQAGPISLTGTRGFSIQGFVRTDEASIPGLSFGIPPGSSFPPADITSSAWFDTTLTLDGRTFPDVGFFHFPTNTFLQLDLVTPLMAPELQPSPVTVTAPFTFTGSFFADDFVHPRLQASFRGSGTVSAIFSAEAGGFWRSEGVRYEFTPQATPEPATLTLVTAGLVASAIRSRRRRRRDPLVA